MVRREFFCLCGHCGVLYCPSNTVYRVAIATATKNRSSSLGFAVESLVRMQTQHAARVGKTDVFCVTL